MADREPPRNHIGTSQAIALLGVTRQQVVNLIESGKIDGHFEAAPRPGRWWIEINDKLEREVAERRAKRIAASEGAELQTTGEFSELADVSTERVIRALEMVSQRVAASVDLQKEEFIRAVVEGVGTIRDQQIKNAEVLADLAARLEERDRKLDEAVAFFKSQSEKESDFQQENLRLGRELVEIYRQQGPFGRAPWWRRWFGTEH